MNVTVIDVIEKGTVARNFLKQMGIANFFDGSLTDVAINRPGEIWTQGASAWKRHDAPSLHAGRVLQAGQRPDGPDEAIWQGLRRRQSGIDAPVLPELSAG
ncbi:hypothetical protein PTKU46_90060 [Paraburkholderia terrae]|nr:hypothetical protein [Paraburkholderia terrae]